MVAKLTGPDAGRDAVMARVKQLMHDDLLPMSDWITQHSEIGFQETQAVEKLTAYLTAHDFEITRGVAGLPTASIGKYRQGTPGPNLGVILEYDALRGTKGAFHGDQHSAQGPVGMMEADALTDVGHQGFLIDAETMAAVLHDFATHTEYRDAVKAEFSRIHTLFGEYQKALEKAYPVPQIPDPQ